MNYANNGIDTASGAVVYSYPSEGIMLQSSSLAYSPVKTGVSYMVTGDACFDSLVTVTT